MKRILPLVLVLLLLAAFAPSRAPALDDSPDLDWHAIGAGGGVSTGGPPDNRFELLSTIGQAEAGTMKGGVIIVDAGFVAGAGPLAGAPVPCIGDLNNDGLVGVADLLLLLASWGPCSPGECIADLNGDGVVGVADLLVMLSAWGPCS